jgi:hypothetical protein
MAVELELRVGAVCSQIKSEGRSQGALPTVATRSGSVGAGAQERYLVGKARDWIAAHRAEITLSLRITVAGLRSFGCGIGLLLLQTPHCDYLHARRPGAFLGASDRLHACARVGCGVMLSTSDVECGTYGAFQPSS